MRILIAGASGLVGTALQTRLRAEGHEVLRLTRQASAGSGELFWNPAQGLISLDQGTQLDAVVNLAGENLAEGRWTSARKTQLLRSRVDATRTLVKGLAALAQPPKVLVNASAIGFYGNRGEGILDETSAIGHGFLPEVCLAWETHAEAAARAGIRTVLLRTGVVLTPAGGALAKLLPVFKTGMGGPLGDGQMWVSWIALDDLVGIICHAITTEELSGPVNAVAPQPVRQVEFARDLGHVLNRPAIVPTPAFALRLMFGEMADEALLASTRVVPAKLNRSATFVFRHPELPEALQSMLPHHATAG